MMFVRKPRLVAVFKSALEGPRHRRTGLYSSPNPVYAVPIKCGIGANEGKVFNFSLCDQKAIKRIAVMPWEPGLSISIFHRDRQHHCSEVLFRLYHPLKEGR
jgi:hypothetical protein